jgi:hypothetical protein
MIGRPFFGDVPFCAPAFHPWIDCSTTEGDLPFKLFRRQLPLRLCFAMTINKAQGQTLRTFSCLLTWSALRGSVQGHRCAAVEGAVAR